MKQDIETKTGIIKAKQQSMKKKKTIWKSGNEDIKIAIDETNSR